MEYRGVVVLPRGLALIVILASACDRKAEPARALPAWPLTVSCRDGSEGATQAVVCELRSDDGVPVRIHVGDLPPQYHIMVGTTATLTLPASQWPASVTEIRFTAGATEIRVPIPFSRLDVTESDGAIRVAYTLCAGCTLELDHHRLETQNHGPGELVIRHEDLDVKYLASAGAPDVTLTSVTADGKRTDQRLNVSTSAWRDRLGPMLRKVAGSGVPWAAPLAEGPPRPALVTVIPDPADPREHLRGLGGLARIRDAQIIVIEEAGEDGGVCPGLYRESDSGGTTQVYRATLWSKVTAFEARTGARLGQKKFSGTRPTCPSSTWESRIVGAPPDDKAIEAWLTTLKPPVR